MRISPFFIFALYCILNVLLEHIILFNTVQCILYVPIVLLEHIMLFNTVQCIVYVSIVQYRSLLCSHNMLTFYALNDAGIIDAGLLIGMQWHFKEK